MLATCPICDKLVPVTTAPRDALDRPRVRVVSHEQRVLAVTRCPGSGKLL